MSNDCLIHTVATMVIRIGQMERPADAPPSGFTCSDLVARTFRSQWFPTILLAPCFRELAEGSEGDLWARLEQWLTVQSSHFVPVSSRTTEPILQALRQCGAGPDLTSPDAMYTGLRALRLAAPGLGPLVLPSDFILPATVALQSLHG